MSIGKTGLRTSARHTLGPDTTSRGFKRIDNFLDGRSDSREMNLSIAGPDGHAENDVIPMISFPAQGIVV